MNGNDIRILPCVIAAILLVFLRILGIIFKLIFEVFQGIWKQFSPFPFLYEIEGFLTLTGMV